jgi:N-acetylmuramoyl-L-alanine amidase
VTLISFAGSPHGGSHKLLPEWRSQPRITPVLIIDHSIVGSAIGAWWYFHDSTGIESHFIIRGRRSGSADGHIWQLMDTDRRADANHQANNKAISIETEDDGDPDTQPWTTAQLQSLIWLHNKLARLYPRIRRREATDCDGPGLGYHSRLGAPSCWTPVAGKLLAPDTPIPTPGGLRPLREIAVGATVFDERGESCRVTDVYDDMPERAWRLRFDDGLEVLAGGEHQWVTITRGQRKGYFRRDRPRDLGRGPRPEGYPPDWARWGAVRDTDELAATLRGPDGGYRHTIPVARPLRLAQQSLPVDPYRLGAPLGVLDRPHVPGPYLVGSAEQRLALLQGLMDTVGSVSEHGSVEFVSTSEGLADAVVWLASSLGQRVRKRKGEATRRGVSFGPQYAVGWSPTIPVFRLPHKLARLRTPPGVRAQSRALVACEPAPIQPMRCLAVDSPNSMYLITDRCLPTHNTCPGRPVRVRQWRQTLLPAFLHPEEELTMAARDEILEAIHNMSRLIRVGDRTGGPADTHDFSSLEGIGRQLDELERLTRLLYYGDHVGGAPDTHDHISVEGLHRRVQGLQSDVDYLKAAVEAIAEATGATLPPPQ